MIVKVIELFWRKHPLKIKEKPEAWKSNRDSLFLLTHFCILQTIVKKTNQTGNAVLSQPVAIYAYALMHMRQTISNLIQILNSIWNLTQFTYY
jgi:hypothetical protein